jgi:hypothetical protein
VAEMNRKGFFVSLTSLIVLIVLIGLVLTNQSLIRERAESRFDDTRKELVSELVFDLESSMIPGVISKSVKNTLVSNSPGETTISQLESKINGNLTSLTDNIHLVFTIPLDNIDIHARFIGIEQVDHYELEIRVEVDYEVVAAGNTWTNRNIEYILPISVKGIIHPAYPDNGAITPEFWDDEWGTCVLQGLVTGATCDPTHRICPVKDLDCYFKGDIPESDPDEPIAESP